MALIAPSPAAVWQPFVVKDPKTGEAKFGRAEVGDQVECPEGHRLGEINTSLRAGTNINTWGQAITFDGDAPPIGTPREKCRCPTCDAIWLWPYTRP